MVGEPSRPPAILRRMENGEGQLPIGSGPGLLLAEGMRNGAGDHALLVREGDASRALITAERQASNGERHRLVVTPLDDDTELRVDGDALAIWLAAGSVGRAARAAQVPAWAGAAGFALLLVLLGFTVLGAATFFAWILELLA
jgi:hypothetical protein